MTMQAAVLRAQTFTVEPRPVPVPGPGEVLLRVRRCGICGSDLHLFRHAADIAEAAAKLGAPPADLSGGLVLGHEYVAEIAAFGPETAQTLAIGDRVVSVPFILRDGVPQPIGANPAIDGAYAEYLIGSEALLLPVPDAIPDEAAALVEPLGIAVHAVARAHALDADRPCVVLGCGPIGLAIVSVLRHRGVRTIIASDPSPRRRSLALAMGAIEAVNPAEASPFTALPPARPALVFDCTGVRGMLEQTIIAVPARSEIVMAGIPHGEDTFTPMFAIARELSLQFVLYYSPDEFAEALRLVGEGAYDWRQMVTATVGLDGVQGAFAALADPETHAKILIDSRA